MPTWVQPVATVVGPVIAACIVLTGVILTLLQNQARLRYEKYEKRASDLEQQFQRFYGDFAAAGFQVIRRLADLYAERADLETVEDVLDPAGYNHNYVDAVHKEYQEAKEERDALRESRAKLNEAYGRLVLLEDDPYRLRDLAAMLGKLEDLSPKVAAENTKALTNELREFCADFGLRIHAQYQTSRLLAEEGRLPPRRIPPPKPPPPAKPTP